jgi:transcriptional regulator with XRE-family HTH domain
MALIADRRKNLGLSQQELANLAGCSIGAVRLFEREVKETKVLRQIEAALTECEEAKAA